MRYFFLCKMTCVTQTLAQIKQDCRYEMYRHDTRADSAEQTAEKNCRPATTKKGFGGGLEGATE